MVIQYRIATADDWAAIAQLHAQSWQQHYRGNFSDHYLDHEVVEDRRRVWQQRLMNPAHNQRVVVAKSREELCGFVCVYLNEHPSLGALLDNIHVDQQYAGQGIGKGLMQQAAAAVIEDTNTLGMYLLVLEKNEGAQRFYQNLGGASEGPMLMDSPDGAQAMVFRFHWRHPEVILKS